MSPERKRPADQTHRWNRVKSQAQEITVSDKGNPLCTSHFHVCIPKPDFHYLHCGTHSNTALPQNKWNAQMLWLMMCCRVCVCLTDRGEGGRGHYNRRTLPADRTRYHDKLSPGAINGPESRGRQQTGRCDSLSSTSSMTCWGEVRTLSAPSRNSQISHCIENAS